MTTARPKLETVPLDQLTPDPGNARVHGSDNLAAIKASLERFGQVRPLLTTGSGTVLAGNGTLAAMQALGWSEARVLRLPWDDPERCRAYAIADNRTAELAGWDDDILAGQVGELFGAGIPMDAFGFEWADAAEPGPETADPAAPADATAHSWRCPACGFRWRTGEGGEVVPL
jgi:ParB-like chromosome segregation protein Spo0J